MIPANAADLANVAGQVVGYALLYALLAARAYQIGWRTADRQCRRQSSPETASSGDLKIGDDSFASSSSRSS